MTNTTPETQVHNDPVNHPKHYTEHPSGIECIQITEHMGFNLGNAVKYAWRCDLKLDAIEDLKKARWYIDREIAKREKAAGIISSGTLDGSKLASNAISTTTFNINAARLDESVIGKAAAEALKYKLENN
jgi:ribosomal protein L35AE/L33A